MRRASPPASTAAMTRSGFIITAAVALGLGPGFINRNRLRIEDDAFDTTKRSEAAAFCPADQGEVRLARQIHPPRREARAADQDRDLHAHDLDDHFRGQAPS